MDSRINQITNLKDCLTSRNSLSHNIMTDDLSELPSPQDIEYNIMRKQIRQSSFMVNSNKHLKIRLHKWIEYLDKIQANRVWIDSRNKYIKLLNLMCYCEVIIQPFNSQPPTGELPNLRKHQINQIIDQVQHCVKTSTTVSRKMSQVHQISPLDTQEIDNLFKQTTEKQQNRFKTYSTNSCHNSQFQNTQPLQIVNFNRQPFQTEDEGKGKRRHSLKGQLKQNIGKKKDQWKVQKTKKSSQGQLTEQKPFSFDKKIMMNRPPKVKPASCQNNKNKGKDSFTPRAKDLKMKQFSQKDLKRPPVYVTKQKNNSKNKTNKDIKRSYWDSKNTSESHTPHTPKYLNNLPCQQSAVEEQEIMIVSVRQKEQNCGCTGTNGQHWFSNLFKKILS